jgi:hypothetical protein
MYLVIISECFSDEDAKLLRGVGHKVITPRSIEKGQKVLDKALKKNLGVPDAVIVDNALKGAQFFAKALKVSLHEGSHKTDIYLVVREDIIGALDPEYFGISGFIEAPLTSKKVLDLVGIPEGSEVAQQTRADIQGPPAAPLAIEKETMTTRPGEADDAVARSFQGAPVALKEQKAWSPHKLAFSAVLGITVILASIIAFGSISRRNEAPPAEELPNFYGMTQGEAEDLASSHGIEYEVEYASSGEPEGIVISQYPCAGTPLEGLGVVCLIVSERQEESESPAPEAGDDQQSIPEEGGSGGALLTDAPPASSHSPAPPPTYTQSPEPAPALPSGSTPVARIAASSTSVSSGSIVTLSAAGSYDPEGGPLDYSWSCGGSGESTSREMVSNIVPGSVTVTVTVTDAEGKSASASITISVY